MASASKALRLHAAVAFFTAVAGSSNTVACVISTSMWRVYYLKEEGSRKKGKQNMQNFLKPQVIMIIVINCNYSVN